MYRMGDEELCELERLLKTKNLFRMSSELQEVANFEREWADYVGAKHAMCVSGGTAALICGLVGLGVGPGDEVIVPGYTFMASAVAVLAVGAIPVLAEINETLTLDPEDAERRISAYTKAIMPVHMMGMPADMEAVNQVADNHGIHVIEDACQADGGTFRGRGLGTWGDVGCHSFNFWKIISAGEGGAVVTDDRDIHERALIHHDSGTAFRVYAGDLRNEIFVGQQYRVSELIGAFLRVQLTRLDGILSDLRSRRRLLSQHLGSELADRVAPSNDRDGDCGVTLALQFQSEAAARAFAEAPGVGGTLPIDTGRHVFTNWTPLIEKRGAYHPGLNPFNLPANQGLAANYGPEVCPRTLDILSRTVYLGINPDSGDDEVLAKAEACNEAFRN